MPILNIQPDVISLGPRETHQFRAVDEAGNPVAVTWTATAGSIDATGKYQAPAEVAAEQSITIKASDEAEPSRTAEAKVTLQPAAAEPPAAPPPAPPPPPAAPPAPPPALKVKPETAVLGAGQTVRFQAMDASQAPVSVSWALAGPAGLEPDRLGRLDRATGDSTVYTAPAEVTTQQFVTVTATGTVASDKAFVVLAPGKVTIVPGEVTLRAGEPQRFQAFVSGDPRGEVDWAPASPGVGSFDQTKGEYTAPPKVPEDQTVTVTATSKVSRDQGSARITLLADPWIGWGPRRLGIWLLVLFLLPVFVYAKWPPPLDRSKLNAAKAAEVEAERVLKERRAELDKAKDRAARLAEQLAQVAPTPPGPNAPAAVPAAPESANLREEKLKADGEVQAETTATALATEDLKDKRETAAVEKTNLELARKDERNLFVLVLLAGALGSFVHVTRSFVDFMGNRRLQPSWTWWYLLQPLTGSALAIVVYLVVRGGFFSGTPAGGITNNFGFVAMAALVGLFSKQATNKLDELFTTLFRTDKERELKDKLQQSGSQAKTEPQRPTQ